MISGAAVEAPGTVRQHLVSITVPVEGLEPEALLRLPVPGPRGFWAREGRWFAHLGVAAAVRWDAPTAAPGGSSPSRFQRVWAQARSLLGSARAHPESPVPPIPPRFFGGFSFLEDHREEGVWEGFPGALFRVPEVELMGSGEGSFLTLRRVGLPGEEPGGWEDEMEEALDGLRRALARAPEGGRPPVPWGPTPRAETDPEAWGRAVRTILEEVFSGAVEKVVLARAMTLSAPQDLDPAEVTLRLRRQNPGAHVFLFEPGPGRALLGAAPETVATVQAGRFRATAVAGTMGVGGSPEERESLARALLASPKDWGEHRLCVQDMAQRLAPLSHEVRTQPEPRVLSLPAIQHLETPIEADLRSDGTVLAVLEALHPTPAVCGLPRDRALEAIRSQEPFQRGWYAGPVGWFDVEGQGVFAPALRSAVVRGREWRLFAGAGIVAGSVPEEEWKETGIKFQPVLRALAGE